MPDSKSDNTDKSNEANEANEPDCTDRKQPAPTSPWEWVAAACGTLVLLAGLAYLGAYAVLHPGGEPDIVLRILDVTPGSGGHQVRFEARNAGNSTAAGVNIGGTLASGGEAVEEADITLDYLPQQSAREATLVFRKDPAGHEMDLRVLGFTEP